MFGYVISCIILGLILLGYIPAMIAASKNHSFLRWYLFGALLFPVALICSLVLKKPVRIINVLSTKESGDRKRKAYRQFSRKKESGKRLDVTYCLTVLLTKAIFGAFLGLVAFAIIRTYSPNTANLRSVCVLFAIIHTLMLSITEIFGISQVPLIADEITKRALQIFAISAIISAPLFFVSYLITTNILFHTQFVRFLFTLATFGLFLIMLFRLQQRYYARFSKFFDYCILSLCSYAVYSALTLIILTAIKSVRWVANVFSMHIHLFDFTYFSGIEYIYKTSTIYLAATVHFIIALLLLLSGLGCRAFKRKELAYRVEYRTKAFRTTLKPALYRHIPRAGIRIVKSVK